MMFLTVEEDFNIVVLSPSTHDNNCGCIDIVDLV